MKFLLFILIILSYSFSNLNLISKDVSAKDELAFDKFIKLLERNEYRGSYGLPVFKPEDITPLLNLAEKEKVLYNFPRNPLSSYFSFSCPIRAVCLWLIEGIRVQDTSSGGNFKYPSLNPVLSNEGERLYENTPSNLDKGLDLYKKWWKTKNFDSLKYVNPLQGSNLIWL
jgi:hypothetical protein